jgi:HD-GYP domain-containing protein (c-di-GMP phosphodiesterase class II)
MSTDRIGELVSMATTGLNHRAVYFADHPRVDIAAKGFADTLAAILEETDDDALFIGVVDERLVYLGRALLGPTLIARRMIDAAQRLHCGGFRFQKGPAADEVKEFFGLCGEPRLSVANLDEARQLLYAHGVFNVILSPAYGQPGWMGGDGEPIAPGVEEAAQEVTRACERLVPLYQGLMDIVERGHGDAAHGRELDVGGARTRVESLLATLGDRPSEILRLSRYPDYDSYTVGHSVRVGLLAVLVGQTLGLPPSVLVEVGTAGLLHDVGKGKIPHEVLFKRGPLDDDERRIMSRHPILGAELLYLNKESSPMSISAAFGHHLRHDRKGYPTVSHSFPFNRVTALLQVCDVFEALTAVRPYKASLPARRAYEIMLQDAAAFDPGAFSAFVRAIGLYPPGSSVLLDTGERAVVVQAGRDISRPTVQLTHGADGRPLAESDRRIMDLDAAEHRAIDLEEIRGSGETGLSTPRALEEAREAAKFAEKEMSAMMTSGPICGCTGQPHGETCGAKAEEPAHRHA